MVFGQKCPNFKVSIFHLFMSLGISACRKTPFGTLKVPQGTFSDTLIRLEAFKRMFVFPPKIDFFFQGVWPKMTKF